jgi:hypothetical protein
MPNTNAIFCEYFPFWLKPRLQEPRVWKANCISNTTLRKKEEKQEGTFLPKNAFVNLNFFPHLVTISDFLLIDIITCHTFLFSLIKTSEKPGASGTSVILVTWETKIRRIMVQG